MTALTTIASGWHGCGRYLKPKINILQRLPAARVSKQSLLMLAQTWIRLIIELIYTRVCRKQFRSLYNFNPLTVEILILVANNELIILVINYVFCRLNLLSTLISQMR